MEELEALIFFLNHWAHNQGDGMYMCVSEHSVEQVGTCKTKRFIKLWCYWQHSISQP